MTTRDLPERLPQGWRHQAENRYLGPGTGRNEVLLVLNYKERFDGWSYNLDVTPRAGKSTRMYNGAFKGAQADAFVRALAGVPEVALGELPALFTEQGLRIAWFRGQQGSEFYEPEQAWEG